MNDHAGNSDLGDVFNFEVTVDLPHISEATNIKMEIFALDPTVGIGGFTLCNVQEISLGSNISPTDDPTYSYNQKEGYDGVVIISSFRSVTMGNIITTAFFNKQVEKGILEWSGITTSGPDEQDLNKIKVTFDAMMVPLPEVSV